MNTPTSAPPARSKRLRVLGAIALCLVGAAAVAWRITTREETPTVEPALEDRSIKLKQELMLLEQKQPPPEPEAAPVEPTRAARKAR